MSPVPGRLEIVIVNMSGLIPSAMTLAGWTTMDEVLEWSGLEPEAWKAVARGLGDTELSDLMIIASVDQASMEEAMANASIEGAPLNAIKKAKVMLTINAVRAKFGAAALAPVAARAAPAVTAADIQSLITAASQTAVVPKLPSGVTKALASKVIDQGMDFEIQPMEPGDVRAARARYAVSEGDAPMDEEEITDTQLAALHVKLYILKIPPFVDMGVWGPHGDRIARAMKFVAMIADGRGGMTTRELPGARSLAEWNTSWRCFRTGMVMLSACPAAVLDRYAAVFNARANEYPGHWGLAAQADIRMHTEWWQAELRRQISFHTEHPQMSAFLPSQAWASIIKASCSEPAAAFWDKEFEKLALKDVCGARALVPCSPAEATAIGAQAASAYGPPPGVWHPQGGKQQRQQKRQSDQPPVKRPSAEQRKDGRYIVSMEGVEIC